VNQRSEELQCCCGNDLDGNQPLLVHRCLNNLSRSWIGMKLQLAQDSQWYMNDSELPAQQIKTADRCEI
jgi:hypothetical protein